MKRRNFIKTSLSTSLVSLAALSKESDSSPDFQHTSRVNQHSAPFPAAITMWDFSWIERRWSGAGYEDWDIILDELLERGYNAVRIDAYPHLVAADMNKTWMLNPVWNQHLWGSPAPNKVQIQPYLNEFLGKCRQRKIKVGLSTWYREDEANTRMQIKSPEIMADQWITTLHTIEREGLIDSLFYVDLCNEWPGDMWCPFFKNDPPEQTWGYWHTGASLSWMQQSIAHFKKAYPDIPVGYSFDFHNQQKLLSTDLSFLDYGEPHIWMSQFNNNAYYNEVGYKYDLFKPDSYHNLALKGEKIYHSRKAHWQEGLKQMIANAAAVGSQKRLPLMTTECWAVVDYKDWPLLEWGWIKELCALGVEECAKSGRWLAIATSNFCGPQFTGMWRDVTWHRRLTDLICQSPVGEDLLNSKLALRLKK